MKSSSNPNTIRLSTLEFISLVIKPNLDIFRNEQSMKGHVIDFGFVVQATN